MTDLNTALRKLKDLTGSSAKTDANLLLRLLNTQLGVIREVLGDESQKQQTLPTDTFTILEEVLWTAKKFILNSCALSSIIAIFRELLVRASGFQIRNMVTATMNVFNTKVCLAGARECALDVLSLIVELRVNDCASQAIDILQTVSKLYKSSDNTVRLRMFRVLSELIKVGNSRLSDLYPDIFKLTQRMASDKHEEIRVEVYNIYTDLTHYLPNFEVITSDVLLQAMTKGFEDETVSVQNASAQAYATLQDILMQTYIDKQEQAKIGAARDGSDPSNNISDKMKPKVQSTSRLSLSRLTSMKKAVVEEIFDFRTMIESIIKNIQKSVGSIRVSFILVMTYLITSFINRIDIDDLEWLVMTLIAIPQDNSIQQMSYEEQMILRVRLSFLFRNSIIAPVNESQLITVTNTLIKCGGGLEAFSRSDIEMQFIMEEVDHALNILGPAAISLRDEAITCANINLRHACFGVRAAAAHVLLTLSCVIPGLACELITNAIANTRKQVLQLITLDINDDTISFEDETATSTTTFGGSSTHGHTDKTTTSNSNNTSSTVAKKKSVKEMERLSRMYFFHGHALVIALIIQHVKHTPQGVPFSLILETFDLGLEMINFEFNGMKMGVSGKQIACAIIRAGGLILSSCLSLGYTVSKMKLTSVLQSCDKLFQMAETDCNNNIHENSDDMLYEIMCIEAATACLYSLLLHANDALCLHENCLSFIIDHLESCFRHIKNKYQPNHRMHFRFRTLYVILLECFALLPAGSYPNSCQQMYVEALRVFRDCITSGVECTSPLIQTLQEGKTTEKARKFSNLGENPAMLYFIQRQLITDETTIIQRLETYTSTLQRKESEAFLSFFGQSLPPLLASTTAKLDCYDVLSSSQQEKHVQLTLFQSSLLDTRSMDAAIKLLAVTFSHQLSEYQDKAIQLFSQAVSQLTSEDTKMTSSTRKLIFSSSASSEEEKRRKDKKNQPIIVAIVCTLYAIVTTFPVHSGQYFDLDYQWRQNLVDQLYSFCTHKSLLIRYLASITLAEFAVKWRGSNIITSISHKIRGSVVSGLEKKGDVHAMDDFGGYVIALGFLWQHAGSLPDTQSLITTTIFDCLNKKDISSTFFSCAFQSLTTICYHYSHTSTITTDEVEEVKDFIEKVLYVIEASHANIMNITIDHHFIQDTIHLLGSLLHLTMTYHLPYDAKKNVLKALQFVFLQSHALSNMQMWCWAMAQIQHLDFFQSNTPASTELKLPLDEIHIAINRLLSDDHVAMCGGEMSDAIASLLHILCQPSNQHPHNMLANKMFYTNCLCTLINLYQQTCAKTILFDFHGLELKEGCAVRSKRYYKNQIMKLEMILEQIILDDIVSHPSHKTVWVLYLRCVVLGLTGDSVGSNGGDANSPATPGAAADASNNNGNSGGDRDDDDEDGNEEGDSGGSQPTVTAAATASKTSTSSTSNPNTEVNINLAAITNLSLLTTYFRDHITKFAPKLSNYRLTTRVFALDLLTHILQSSVTEAVTVDMIVSRQQTEEMLHHLKQQSSHHACSLSTLITLPIPWELYLVDLINLSCYCVGFALHDKNQPHITETATDCVLTLIQVFLHVKDPDFVSVNPTLKEGETTVEDRILTQFLSQLSGVVRTTLATAKTVHNPRQLRLTTMILLLLVEEGFLRDKIVLKRMFKPLSTFFDDFFYIPETATAEQQTSILLRPKNDKVHETVALEEMLIFTQTLAELLLLINTNKADSGVKVAIESLQNEIGSQKINRLFVGVLVDTLRMQLEITTAVDSRQAVTGSLVLHPLRGGQTYSPCGVLNILSDTSRLKSTFFDVTLTFALTLSSSSEISLQGDLLLFVVTFVTLELSKIDLQVEGKEKLEKLLSAAQALTAKSTIQEIELLLMLHQLHRLLLLQSSAASSHAGLIRKSMRIIMNISPTCKRGQVLAVLEDIAQLIFTILFPQLLVQDTTELIAVDDVVKIFSSTTQSTMSVDENIVKELVICFAMIAAKTEDNMTLLHIARLFALLALHQVTTPSSAFLTPKSEVCMTLMKAYGRVYSLLDEEGKQEETEQVVRVVCLLMQEEAIQQDEAAERIENVMELTVLLWMATANATASTTSSTAEAETEEHEVASAFPQELFDLLIITTSAASTVFQRQIIPCMLRLLAYLPTDASKRVGHQVVLEVICKVMIAHRLPIEEDTQNRSLILRGALLIFNLLFTSEQRMQFLQLLLPLLCGNIQRFANDAAYQLLTGKVLAHLARLSSDEFKTQVLLLNDTQRQNLQQAMRVAILSEQQQSQPQAGQQQPGGVSAPGGLKLNVDRYRAANT